MWRNLKLHKYEFKHGQHFVLDFMRHLLLQAFLWKGDIDILRACLSVCACIVIALGKNYCFCFYRQKVLIFFLILHENICCGYSLEAPCWGTSNEYPQHMFLWWNKKTIRILPLSWAMHCASLHIILRLTRCRQSHEMCQSAVQLNYSDWYEHSFFFLCII